MQARWEWLTCFWVYWAMLVTSTKAVTFVILDIAGTLVSRVGELLPAHRTARSEGECRKYFQVH